MRRPSTRLDYSSQYKKPSPCAMKLVIRSAYWGNTLRGKPFVDQATGARPNRTISCQAVLKNEGQFWGCCPSHGKRVLEMTEQHFIDTFSGDWVRFRKSFFVRLDRLYLFLPHKGSDYVNRWALGSLLHWRMSCCIEPPPTSHPVSTIFCSFCSFYPLLIHAFISCLLPLRTSIWWGVLPTKVM